MSSGNSFQTFYFGLLGALYQMETQLAAALPQLNALLGSGGFSSLAERAQRETKRQVSRLEEVFALLNCSSRYEPNWGSAKLIIDAYEAARLRTGANRISGVAQPLLGLTSLEILHYEGLLDWSFLVHDDIGTLLRPSLIEELALARELRPYAKQSPASMFSRKREFFHAHFMETA